MNLVKRAKAPSPKFFVVLRNIGLALAAVGGSLLAAPIALPVVLTAVGGYLAVAGGVISAVSQLTTIEEETAKAAEQFVPTTGRKIGVKTGRKTGLQKAQPENTPDHSADDGW